MSPSRSADPDSRPPTIACAPDEAADSASPRRVSRARRRIVPAAAGAAITVMFVLVYLFTDFAVEEPLELFGIAFLVAAVLARVRTVRIHPRTEPR